MAAGDRLIDADGNVLVDADGNGVVKDANNECPECCGPKECWHRWESEYDCVNEVFGDPTLAETICLKGGANDPTPQTWTQNEPDSCILEKWVEETDTNGDNVGCTDASDCSTSPDPPTKPTSGEPSGCCPACPDCPTGSLANSTKDIYLLYVSKNCDIDSTDGTCSGTQGVSDMQLAEGILKPDGPNSWSSDGPITQDNSLFPSDCFEPCNKEFDNFGDPDTGNVSVRYLCSAKQWQINTGSGWFDVGATGNCDGLNINSFTCSKDPNGSFDSAISECVKIMEAP